MQKNIQNITAVIEYIEAHLTEKLDLDTIADAVHSVSYTHLDVYKRQEYCLLISLYFICIICL